MDTLFAWASGFVAGYDRGYEGAIREVNGDYPEPRVLAFGQWYDQALERQRADAETRRLLAEGQR